MESGSTTSDAAEAVFTARARVRLPENSVRPFTVYVNGVEQREGVDFLVEAGVMSFCAALRQEGRLGFWRWAAMFIGVFGSYGQNDCVDVMFRRDGRTLIETTLTIESLVSDDQQLWGDGVASSTRSRSFDTRTGPFSGGR